MSPDSWNNLNDLFQAALEREPSERSAFLKAACAGDSTLLAQVEKLVNAHVHAGSFIQAPVFGAAVQLFAAPDDSIVAGQLIGPYRVVKELGRGGMGAVYLAERADQQFEKQVAIKLIKRGMDTEYVLQRFRIERQILATLEHPNIARLLDGGTTDTGLPYFVMEYIDGVPVDDYCDSLRLPVSERLLLFQQVCSAVSYAHQRRIVHRDIKPSNILVTQEGVPKLVDFGIAKILHDASSGEYLSTATGLRPMTPEYASPEQICGEHVTPASDIYSLGVVLYELLTGHLPYRVKTRPASDIERLIRESEPEKPSIVISRVAEVPARDGTTRRPLTPQSVSQTRDGHPDKLRRRLAGDLDNIVLMALRKEPDRRYSTVDQLSADISRHLQNLPVVARKDTLVYRASKFAARNRVRVVESVIFAVILVVVLFAGLRLASPPQKAPGSINSTQARKLVILPFINLKPDAETEFLSYSMAETIATRLNRIRTLSVVPASAVYKYRSQAMDPLKAAHEMKADLVLTGNYLQERDVLRVSAQLVDVSSTQAVFQDDFTVSYQRLLTLHETVARRLISVLNLNLSAAELESMRRDVPQNPLAWEYYLRGIDHLESARLQMAMDALEKSVKLDPQFAWAWTELGAAYVVNAALRFGGGEMYDKAQAAFDRAIELNPAEPRPKIMMSDMFIETNRVEQAVSLLREILQQHPHHAMATWQLSYAYRYAGMLEESGNTGQAAYEADPGFTPRSTVFNTWLYLGQYERFRDTLPAREASAYLLFYRGFADYHLKNFPQAAAHFDRAYDLDPAMLQARVGKALSFSIAGRRNDGLDLMRETAAQLQQRGLNDPEGIYKVAQAFAVLNDRAAALTWLRASITGGFFCYPYFNTDPLLANIRHSPGFDDALALARKRHEDFKRRFFSR